MQVKVKARILFFPDAKDMLVSVSPHLTDQVTQKKLVFNECSTTPKALWKWFLKSFNGINRRKQSISTWRLCVMTLLLWKRFRELLARPVKWPPFFMIEIISLLPFTYTNWAKRQYKETNCALRDSPQLLNALLCFQQIFLSRPDPCGQDIFHACVRKRLSTWLTM